MSRCALVVALAVVPTLGAPSLSCRRQQDVASSSSSSPPLPSPGEVFEPVPLAPGELRPLVILLHGLGGSGAELFKAGRLGELARAHRLFVVAPDGTPDRARRLFWNAGDACCNFDRLAIDDVARLRALIDEWRARPGVDPARVYVVGFSNGGFMAHRLACDAADRIAAVASIAGAAPDPDVRCGGTAGGASAAGPVAVLEVHGDADDIVRYQGGRVFDAPELAPFPSAPAGMRAWADRLGCRGPVVEETAASHRVRRFTGCARGGAELWTIPGGDHHTPSPALLEEIWTFLERWPR
jgi:polyhydroxybutyrate depolymerase